MDNLCKILIVDDEYLLRQGIKHLINWEKEGFEITGEASNGKEAIELIDKLKPHIIISDVVMPVMDGVDLSRIVKTKYPEIQIIILSSYSDFKYVKDTFKHGINDYILKPKLKPEDLICLLKNTAANIPNFVLSTPKNLEELNLKNFLNKLISGFDATLDQKKIKKFFPYNSFLLLGTNLKKSIINTSSNSLSLKAILSETCKDNLNNVVYYEINVDSNLFLLLINFDLTNKSNIAKKIDKIYLNTSNKFSKIFFVVSKVFDSIYKLKDVYIYDFKSTLGYKFYLKGKNIIYSKDILKNDSKYKFDFKYYSNQVYMLNLEAALNYLKNYISFCIKSLTINEFDLKTLFENSLYSIINILDELSFNIEEINDSKREYFEKIDNAESADELMDFVDVLENKFNALLEHQKNSFNNHIISEIIEYIYEHYDEQLSLKELANKFHFNYYYLSSYFSSHSSEGFSEYLNKVRVEKASKLLFDEKIPVSEISYMVGYSDHSYFCKVFKKLKKLTPSKYRKLILDKKRGSYV
ncbi:response regulator transcription factor [Clostridium guangxiense]|uniref:response regulator transcription factor n=1 Tax=Clostridium guangxiense TaxID=1662055 RepID=UPI001E2DDB05|nr:response regulator [Clostridium guangxiense]MCD2347766.1 response regulator [Clostridium guangxiense]